MSGEGFDVVFGVDGWVSGSEDDSACGGGGVICARVRRWAAKASVEEGKADPLGGRKAATREAARGRARSGMKRWAGNMPGQRVAGWRGVVDGWLVGCGGGRKVREVGGRGAFGSARLVHDPGIRPAWASGERQPSSVVVRERADGNLRLRSGRESTEMAHTCIGERHREDENGMQRWDAGSW